MNKIAFEEYLNHYLKPNGAHLAVKAIEKRLRKAEEAEAMLGHVLDVSVATEEQMRMDLIALRENNPVELRYGQMQNALRKYYHMTHGHWFQRLSDI